MPKKSKSRVQKAERPQLPIPGITAVRVGGFKSLSRPTEFGIRPLTIFAGANSSGKSSAMQPLLLLKQTLEASFDPGGILLDGPNVKFTSAGQLLSRSDRGVSTDTFSAGLSFDDGDSVDIIFKKPRNKPVEPVEFWMKSRTDGRFALKKTSTNEEVRANVPSNAPGIFAIAKDRKNAQWSVVRDRAFLRFEVRLNERDGPLVIGSDYMDLPLVRRCKAHIRDIIHVPGLRGNPERTHRTTGVGTTYPGNFGDYIASIILGWQQTDDPKLRRLAGHLEELGLTWKVEATRWDDTSVELRVGRFRKRRKGSPKDLVSIADVGFGVSQTLPVLVALLAARRGEMVYIEQPEIHLHPRAQGRLAAVFIEAAVRGVRVVVETHSSILLLALQTAVASGEIPASHVNLHWFARGDDGVTEITTGEVDVAGRFGSWPVDFADVELEQEDMFLSAVSRRERER